MQSKKILLCVMTVVAVGLVGNPAAAQDPPPYSSCVTAALNGSGGNWLVEVVDEPCAVSCDYSGNGTFCDPTGQAACTGIVYEVEPLGDNADHLAIMLRDLELKYPKGVQISDPCAGDDTIGIGEYMCHEQVLIFNELISKRERFEIVVAGPAFTIGTSVIVKAGRRTVESCKIAGLGGVDLTRFPSNCVPSCGNFDEKQSIVKKEIIQFEDCFVEFEYDTTTGEIFNYGLAQICNPATDAGCCDISVGCQGGSGDTDCCDYNVNPPINSCDAFELEVGEIALTADNIDLNGDGVPDLGLDVPLGDGQFGDGYLSTGDDSCSCRVFAGRVYCWGSPCPDYSSR